MPEPTTASGLSECYTTAKLFQLEAITQHLDELLEGMLRPESAAGMLVELHVQDAERLGAPSEVQEKVLQYIVDHRAEACHRPTLHPHAANFNTDPETLALP